MDDCDTGFFTTLDIVVSDTIASRQSPSLQSPPLQSPSLQSPSLQSPSLQSPSLYRSTFVSKLRVAVQDIMKVDTDNPPHSFDRHINNVTLDVQRELLPAALRRQLKQFLADGNYKTKGYSRKLERIISCMVSDDTLDTVGEDSINH